MNDKSKYWLDKAILLLVVVSLVLFIDNRIQERFNIKSNDTTIIVYHGDTNIYSYSSTNLKPIIIRTTDTQYVNIDSSKIIDDYLFNRKLYIDTIVNDSSTFIWYRAVVRYNELDTFKLNWSNKRLTKTEFIVNQDKPDYIWRIYGGADVGLNSLTPMLCVQYKNSIFDVGYELADYKGIRIGYKRLIFTKK